MGSSLPFVNDITTGNDTVFCCILYSLHRASLKTGNFVPSLGKLFNLPREETAQRGWTDRQTDKHGQELGPAAPGGKRQQRGAEERNPRLTSDYGSAVAGRQCPSTATWHDKGLSFQHDRREQAERLRNKPGLLPPYVWSQTRPLILFWRNNSFPAQSF